MSRHSSIVTHAWVTVGRRSCRPAVSIGKLVCVQMQVVQCLDVIAAGGTQKPSPERAQMIPSGAQVLMVVIRNEPQVAQTQLRNDPDNVIGHCKQRRCEARVLPDGAPSDDERISHQLNCALTGEQAHRCCRPTLPRRVALRSLPPGLVSEVDVGEQKRTSARPPACRRIQRYPKIAVYPHHLRQRARIAFPDHLRCFNNEPLVEFMNELEARAARPGRGHE